MVAGIAAALLLPQTAGGTVTIGSSMGASNAGGSCAAPPCTRSQSVLPGRLVTSPVTGTVVRWRATVSPTTRARLRVISPFGAGLKFAATGPIETPGTSDLSAPVSLPISIGDRIGVDLLDPTMAGLSALRMISPNAGASFDSWQPSPADGAPAPAPTVNPDMELLLAADVLTSNHVSVSEIKRNKKNGTARLSLEIPNPGKLVFGAAKGSKPLVKPKTLQAAAGPLEVTLRPSKRAKERLRDSGKAKGKVGLTFTLASPNGDPPTETTTLRLKLFG